MTRAEVLRAVASDLNGLVEEGVLGRWALCGALALAVWGAPRAILGIDVLADPAAGRPPKPRGRSFAGAGPSSNMPATPAIRCRSCCG